VVVNYVTFKYFLEYLSLRSATLDIGNRLLGYMLESRAVPQSVTAIQREVNQPQTSPVFTAPKGDLLAIQRAREEAPCESQG